MMNGEEYLADLRANIDREEHVIKVLRNKIEGQYATLRRYERVKFVDAAKHISNRIDENTKKLRAAQHGLIILNHQLESQMHYQKSES